MDVKAILGQAMDTTDLLRRVQWISKYLWFLSWDPASAKSPYFSSLLRTLAGLHEVGRTATQPLADSILRAECSGDGQSSDPVVPGSISRARLHGASRTADHGAADTGSGESGSCEGQGGVSTAGGSFTGLGLCMRSVLDSLWERLGGRPGVPVEGVLPEWPAGAGGGGVVLEVDSRLMQLCCPLLEQARLSLQVGILRQPFFI